MFRQEEILMGGWSDKTPEAMQKRRFEHSVKQLGPLGAKRFRRMHWSADWNRAGRTLSGSPCIISS